MLSKRFTCGNQRFLIINTCFDIPLARAPPLINGITIAGTSFHVKIFPSSNRIKHINDVAHVLIEKEMKKKSIHN
jgi:hypothetical protein